MSRYKSMNFLMSAYLVSTLLTLSFIGIFVIDEGQTISTAKADSIIVDINGFGNYTSIQSAIDAANPGDTIYVWDGTYNEMLILNKTVTLIGNGTYRSYIKGDAFLGHVLFVTADNVSISNFQIRDSGTSAYNSGIRMSSANDVKIENCIVGRNREGIFLNHSQRVLIANSSIHTNSYSGVLIEYSSYVTVKNCTMSGNNNDGIGFWHSSHSTFEGNTIGSDDDGIFLRTGNYNKVINNQLGGNAHGIRLYDSDHNTVTDNSVTTSRGHGMFIKESHNNDFIDNYASGNNGQGFYFLQSSNNNVIDGEANTNTLEGIGLSLSDNNNFYNIDLKFNKNVGLYFYDSKNNYVENCSIASNTNYDIFVQGTNGKNTAINTTINNIFFQSTGLDLVVKNYLFIQLNDESSAPVPYGEVEVKEDSNVIYSTSGYGGSDAPTNIAGQIKWLLVEYGTYRDTDTIIKKDIKINVKKDGKLYRNENNVVIDMSSSHFEYYTPNNIAENILLISPLNKSILNSSTLEFKWNAATEPDGDSLTYSIEVWEIIETLSVLVASTQLDESTTSWIPSYTFDSGIYKWRVCAYDGLEYNPWSEMWRFTVDTDIPIAAKPVADCTVNNTGAVIWRWQPSFDTFSSIAGYYVYIGTEPNLNNVISGVWTTNNWYEKANLKDGKNYYCRIKAVNNAGTISAYSPSSAGVLVDLDIPEVSKPLVSTKYNNTGRVTWSWPAAADTGSGIKGYYVTITRGEDRIVFIDNASTTDNWFTYTKLLDGNTYYCSIKAENGAGTKSSSSGESAEVIVDLTAPSMPEDLLVTPEGWSSTKAFSVSWENPEDYSGIAGAFYKLIDKPLNNYDGSYFSLDEINSIDGISVKDDGETMIYVWLKDRAGNIDASSYSVSIIYFDGTPPPPPISIKVTPDDWSSNNSFTIDWTVPEDFSGIKIGAYCYIGLNPPTSQSDGTWMPTKPFIVNNVLFKKNDVYIWLEDNLGNNDSTKYKKATLKLDTIKPTIKHTPVQSVDPDSVIEIEVEVSDQESGIKDVIIYYKGSKDRVYTPLNMAKQGAFFIATFEQAYINGDRLEYYIKAEDKAFPANVIYYGLDGETETEPTSETDIEVALNKPDTGSTKDSDSKGNSAVVIGISAVIIIIAVVLLLFFINIRKRRSEGQEPLTSPGSGAGLQTQATTQPTGIQVPPQPVYAPSEPILPAAPAIQNCPVCSSVVSEDNKCASCGWEKQLF